MNPSYVEVSDIFWGFCKAAANANSMDEFMDSSEYKDMNDAVCSGLKLSISPFPPLRKFGPSLVRHLPNGCSWNADDSLYVFDGINELFYGVREILDPHAYTHEFVLEKCIKRINGHIDTTELAESLSSFGVWVTK